MSNSFIVTIISNGLYCVSSMLWHVNVCDHADRPKQICFQTTEDLKRPSRHFCEQNKRKNGGENDKVQWYGTELVYYICARVGNLLRRTVARHTPELCVVFLKCMAPASVRCEKKRGNACILICEPRVLMTGQHRGQNYCFQASPFQSTMLREKKMKCHGNICKVNCLLSIASPTAIRHGNWFCLSQ